MRDPCILAVGVEMFSLPRSVSKCMRILSRFLLRLEQSVAPFEIKYPKWIAWRSLHCLISADAWYRLTCVKVCVVMPQYGSELMNCEENPFLPGLSTAVSSFSNFILTFFGHNTEIKNDNWTKFLLRKGFVSCSYIIPRAIHLGI